MLVVSQLGLRGFLRTLPTTIESWTSPVTGPWSSSILASSSATWSPPCVTSGVISNDIVVLQVVEYHHSLHVANSAGLFTLHLLRVRRLYHWRLVKHDILAQDDLFFLWIPKFVAFHIFLETHKGTFPRSQTQLVFLDMIIGWTTKYPKWVIILSNFSWPNFQRSLASYRKLRQPVNEMAGKCQCLNTKEFR